MPAADLVITSRRVVTPAGTRPGAVIAAGGVITDVVPTDRAPPAARRLDAGDAVLLPGLVDTHVHVNEPGRTEWEGFATATRAAAAGGVTTLVDMPLNSVPPTTSVTALTLKRRAANGQATVDYGLWGGVIPDNHAALGALLDAGVLGFKCFLVASGVPEFPPVSEADLRRALPLLAERNAVLLAHCEVAARLVAPAGDPRRHATWLASRPPAAELAAIDLLLALAAETGCRVHVVHLSAAAGIERVVAARAAGTRVTVETCPHYLTFAAEDIPDGATAFKCAPPIRERANRELLWEGLKAGAIDLVVSDHSPAPPEIKHADDGDFLAAWGGIASLELALPAVWTAGRSRGATPGDLARWMAAAPAALAGLSRKGCVAPGYDADLVVFDPDAEFQVDPSCLRQRHHLTPYAGMTLAGVVRQVFVRGTCVYDDGRFPTAPVGRPIERESREQAAGSRSSQ
jgi:allantoinase